MSVPSLAHRLEMLHRTTLRIVTDADRAVSPYTYTHEAVYVELKDVLRVIAESEIKHETTDAMRALMALRKPASDSQRMVLSRQWLDDRLTLTPELKAYMQALDRWFEEQL